MAVGTIAAFWCWSPNFGDALGPWLIERMTGKKVVYAAGEREYEHHVTAGSILNWSNKHSTVWGAGLGSIFDNVVQPHEIRAVRGPLSRFRAQTCDVQCPAVYGDPALVLPRFIPPAGSKRKKVGIVAHYVDMFRICENYSIHPDAPIKIIDARSSVDVFVEEVTSCEFIVSSSLHGLIVADAYGIPNLWAQFGDSLGGDGTKFWDHFLVMNRATMNEPPKPVDMREHVEEDLSWWARQQYQVPNMEIVEKVAEGLMEVCPFKKEAE